MKNSIPFHCLLLALCTIGCSVGYSQLPYTIADESMESAILGDEISLKILIPNSYHSSKEDFQIVYYLDSDWWHYFTNMILGTALRHGWTENVISVGIDTTGAKRPYYLTPTRRGPHAYFENQIENSGGASAFLECIQKEIIPFVESDLRISSDDRTLIGHSFGGLFCLFTVLQEGQPFTNVIAGSPTLPWDDNALLDIEAKFNESNSSLPVNLYMAVGSDEEEPGDPMVSTLTVFVAQLNSRNYERLNYKFLINEDDDHWSNPYVTTTKGFKWIFAQANPKE